MVDAVDMIYNLNTKMSRALARKLVAGQPPAEVYDQETGVRMHVQKTSVSGFGDGHKYVGRVVSFFFRFKFKRRCVNKQNSLVGSV